MWYAIGSGLPSGGTWDFWMDFSLYISSEIIVACNIATVDNLINLALAKFLLWHMAMMYVRMQLCINNIVLYQQKGQTPREMAECQDRLYTLRMIKDVEKVTNYKMYALSMRSVSFEWLMLHTSCKLHINIKPFICQRHSNKKCFNRSLNKGGMAWQ